MNKENLTVHFKVKDFNAWRSSYTMDTRRIARLPESQTAECSVVPKIRTMW